MLLLLLFLLSKKKFKGPRVSCFHHFMTGWEEKPSRWFSIRIKKRRTDGERDVVTRVVQSPRCRILIRTQEKMAAWLLVGVYFYLFIYSPFRVGCWLYKLTTTELWASRRKWSRQFHALSSFFFFYNGCCYYYTTRVCVSIAKRRNDD